MTETLKKLNKLYQKSKVDWIEEYEGYIIYTLPRTWMLSDIEQGTHNGYIILPKDHIWVKQYNENEWNQCDAPMHGGCTFGSEFEDKFILGFDTAHCDDGPHLDHNWIKKELYMIATTAKLDELKAVKTTIELIHEPCMKVIEAQQELLKIKEETISELKEMVNLLKNQIKLLEILTNDKKPLN